MIELLDYIQDLDDNFWIVNYISELSIKGYKVYTVNEKGNRYNNITKKYYFKSTDTGLKDIPKQYKKIFKPRIFYKQNKDKLFGIWKEYINVLNEVGIKNIGIFGSYLIGFDVIKDIDFIIYGYENLLKYKKYNDYIKRKINAKYISDEHIEKQYNKHKDKFPPNCDLKKIISRNWSGIQLKNDVLSTPRFIDKNIIVPEKIGIDKKITVRVIDDYGVDLVPRIASVEYNNKIYKMITPIWKYQSFGRKKDILEIYANVNEKDKIIILDEFKHYIRFIESTQDISY